MSESTLPSEASVATMLAKKATDQEIINHLVETGWLPVTRERKGYIQAIDLNKPLKAAGLILVDRPVFESGGRQGIVKSVRSHAIMKATDDPQDLPALNPEATRSLVAFSRQWFTHVHKVMAHRSELRGYVAPDVWLLVRGARFNTNNEQGYVSAVEISPSYAETFANNCAVIERTADGKSVGVCTFYLDDGKTCPRHGQVKIKSCKES